MTICNMSIEGGARVGYVNPDETTFAFLRGRPVRAGGRRVRSRGRSGGGRSRRTPTRATTTASRFDAASDRADGHLGHQPGPVGRHQRADRRRRRRGSARVHGLRRRGARVDGTRIDVAFIGSCTNGRLSDLEEAARLVRGRHVAPHVKALVVPGSQAVSRAAEAQGLDQIFTAGRLRMARRRLLDVPGDEPRPARRPPGLRVVVEPQLQGTPGQPDRPHAADEPGDGRRGGDRRRSRRRATRCSKRCRMNSSHGSANQRS